jgi:hypothetical protein
MWNACVATTAARFRLGAMPRSIAVLVGGRSLYWWTSDSWQRGTVARICAPSASGFTHVVAYTRQTSALRNRVDTLLDTAFSTGNAGCCRLSEPRAGLGGPTSGLSFACAP